MFSHEDARHNMDENNNTVLLARRGAGTQPTRSATAPACRRILPEWRAGAAQRDRCEGDHPTGA